MTKNIYIKNDYTEQSTGDTITGGFVINDVDWTDEQLNAEYNHTGVLDSSKNEVVNWQVATQAQITASETLTPLESWQQKVRTNQQAITDIQNQSHYPRMQGWTNTLAKLEKEHEKLHKEFATLKAKAPSGWTIDNNGNAVETT